MSEQDISTIRQQFRQQREQRGLYDRLLTTEEAAAATGISQYELRKGAAEGRYPVILLGSPANKFRKMRWNLDMLMNAIMNQAGKEDEIKQQRKGNEK